MASLIGAVLSMRTRSMVIGPRGRRRWRVRNSCQASSSTENRASCSASCAGRVRAEFGRFDRAVEIDKTDVAEIGLDQDIVVAEQANIAVAIGDGHQAVGLVEDGEEIAELVLVGIEGVEMSTAITVVAPRSLAIPTGRLATAPPSTSRLAVELDR